jgi:OFA family oxalate/formate antiporter-like MFS transporter
MALLGCPRSDHDKAAPPRLLRNRWLQLAAGIVAMVAVSNLQYGWTLFVGPIKNRHPDWEAAAIQLAFTVFVVMETWLVPLEVYLADRRGPRLVVMVGGFLAALSWTVNSLAGTIWVLYLGNALGGMGAGMVYGTAMGSALKWFPDRRGLAAGLTAAAWGAGSALTVRPVQQAIAAFGYEGAFLGFGLVQGGVVLLVAQLLRAPRNDELSRLPACAVAIRSSRDYTPGQMLRTPAFWLMYAMMVMVTMGGLMAMAQISLMAKDYGVSEVTYYVFGASVTALTLALELDRLMGGVTRPIFGWISDHIGREKTMLIAFSMEGLAILLWIELAHDPLWFLLLSGLTFFAWGEVFSLFPALVGDLFGRRFACTNYGLLYTAKGMAALLVPLGNLVHQATGSWRLVFALAVVFDLTAALLAWFVLRPLRARAQLS